MQIHYKQEAVNQVVNHGRRAAEISEWPGISGKRLCAKNKKFSQPFRTRL